MREINEIMQADDIHILVDRIAKRKDYTISHLYIDGERFCDVCEDADRGLTSDMSEEEIMKIKINGKTAIPAGNYEVTLGIKSAKFSTKKYEKLYGWINGYLPRILNVPGFKGVLFHCGNSAEDSSACLILGENKVKGKVINSAETFKRFYKRINTGGRIFLTIR